MQHTTPIWIRAVTLANRVVLLAVLLVVLLIAVLLLPGFVNHDWERGWFYPVFAIGVPLTWVAGMVTGPAAVLLHLLSRWGGFWHSAAPAVLAIVCLNFAMASIPPPPALGAVIAVVLGALCVVPLRHAGGRGWGMVPLLVLPFLDRLPLLAFWAPLVAALVFLGVWAVVCRGWRGLVPRK